jgi:hypothetical protein
MRIEGQTDLSRDARLPLQEETAPKWGRDWNTFADDQRTNRGTIADGDETVQLCAFETRSSTVLSALGMK